MKGASQFTCIAVAVSAAACSTADLNVQGLGEMRIDFGICRIYGKRHLIMPARDVGAPHAVVAGRKTDHRFDIVRLFPKRLAIGLYRERDIAEREVGIALCDPDIGRLTPLRQVRFDRPDGELACTAGRGAQNGDDASELRCTLHVHYPLNAGINTRIVRITAGSISTPIITGNMQVTSGMESSTGSR